MSRREELLKIAPMLDAIGEHGMAQDARELAAEHTGLTAVWCPVCGDCTCDQDDDVVYLDGPDCPIHGTKSNHKDSPST